MVRLTGKPKNWLASIFIGAGFPVLLAALLFAAATPSAELYQSPIAAEEQAAPEGMPEAASLTTWPMTVDLAGWEFYLHSDDGGISTVGLPPTGSALSAAAGQVIAGFPAPMMVPLPVRPQYPSQGPPA